MTDRRPQHIPATGLRRVRPTVRRSLLAALLVLAVAGCGGITSSDVTALRQYDELRTATGTTVIKPSELYCGAGDKVVQSAGGCSSHATDGNGPLPAFERTEVRGWVLETPAWTGDQAEVAFGVLLDWGWPAAPGVRAINTPEAIIQALTPHNIIGFGHSPADRTMPSSRLLTGAVGASAWGGPNAAVVHVEVIGWRVAGNPPADWGVSKTDGNGTTWAFPFDPFRPVAQPPMQRDLLPGDYVRLVGTEWEDGCHCAAGVGPGKYDGGGVAGLPITDPESIKAEEAKARWHDGSFNLGPIGRGWTELHPVDYMAVLDSPTHPNDVLEVISMAGESELLRSIKLPPKPSATAHVVFRKIDSGFTLLNAGDLALEDITASSDGINAHIKLNGRSGIKPGYAKYFAGFYVAWQE